MTFEHFQDKGDDIKDAAQADMPQVVGNNPEQLRSFEPNTGKNNDVMPPLRPEEQAEADAEAWLDKNDPLRKNTPDTPMN